jgi:hypothetical protein
MDGESSYHTARLTPIELKKRNTCSNSKTENIQKPLQKNEKRLVT